MEPKVTLSEAIRELRSQLAIARAEGEGSAIRFAPKSIEVELDITFSVEAEAGGGFKLYSLVDVSGKGRAGNESTHKVKLTLEPVGTSGPVLIADTEREKQ